MTRSAAVLDGRGGRPATLAAVALLALLAGLAYMALRPAPAAESSPPSAVPKNVASPAVGAWLAVKASAPTQEAPKAPPEAAATQPKDRAISRPADVPYRFIGRSTTGAETSIVLFGRGRIVNLRGPGPIDDEYVVDAVFDEYLVLRHVPTSIGKFLELAQRRHVVEPPRDPEEWARD